jgi:mannosyltransferase OCH1-like enzyme
MYKNILIVSNNFKPASLELIAKKYNIYLYNNRTNRKLKSIEKLDEDIFNYIDYIVIDINKLISSFENLINNSLLNKPIYLFSSLKFNINNNNCTYVNYSKLNKVLTFLDRINNIYYEKPEDQKCVNVNVNVKLNDNNNNNNNNNNKASLIDLRKLKYRNLCIDMLSNICKIKIPDIELNKNKEAIYIEYRQLEHTEVLIRNCILKLGSEWSYTVICGEESFNFYSNMCKNIHPKIKIINTGHAVMSQNMYNNFLLTKEFWNLVNGEKILIYQEDSFIFKNNIDDFLEWDYIGAPFKMDCVQGNNVGNGGLSLRNKSKMIEIIEKVPLTTVDISQLKQVVKRYMTNSHLDNIPEDIYFSTYLQKTGLGKVADFESAKKFSSETIWNEESFGMHCMWNGCTNWEKYIKIDFNKLSSKAIPKPVGNEYDENYFNKIKEYCQLMKKNEKEILSNAKEEFRYFCFRYLDYIRCLELPIIGQNNYYEAVLVEYRCLPHIEFLLRNCIHKLGSEWSQTIICGNLNYDYILNIVKNIDRDIKVIKTDYDNLYPSDYSLFLSSKSFWDLLYGEKILIYQEDTCIFKNNIMDFVEWDYIGAPWNKHQNDTPNCVGNGGLSLRSKSIMLEVISKIGIKEAKYNSSTISYMTNTNSLCPPEDVYFSKNIQDLNIGKVADWDTAYKFSSECVLNKESFGCHNLWCSTTDWKKIIYNNLIKKIINDVLPLNIYLTWESKDLPNGIKHNIENLKIQNPEFNILYYDDNDCEKFIKENFDEDVLISYKALIPGAYKADLFRLSILYMLGGIYLDIKYNCVNNFKLINLINGDNYYVKDRVEIGCAGIYNGFMIFKKKSKELLLAINQIVSNVKNEFYGNSSLEVTGPDLLVKYFDRNKTNIRFNQINGVDIIYLNEKEILKSYPNYRKESRLYSTKKHYGNLWNNREIYDYIYLKELFIIEQIKYMYGYYYDFIKRKQTIFLNKDDYKDNYVITTDNIKENNYTIQRGDFDPLLIEMFKKYYNFDKKSILMYKDGYHLDKCDDNKFLLSHNRYINNKKIILTMLKNYSTIDKSLKHDDRIEFVNKKDILVFRGSTTGLEENSFLCSQRYKIISKNINNKNFDIGFNKLVQTDRIDKMYLDEINTYVKSFLTHEEILNYKFVLCIPGNDYSSIFRFILNSNSCPLHTYPLKYSSYYNYDKLLPWVHFVPIKEDGSDLEEKYDWCLKNLSKCNDIAKNGKQFMKNYLDEEIENEIKKRFVELYPIIKFI